MFCCLDNNKLEKRLSKFKKLKLILKYLEYKKCAKKEH